MVDSILQIVEGSETNNISGPLAVAVTPAPTPTPTATPAGGASQVSGAAYARISNWLPQFRALLSIVDQTTGQTVASTQSDINGRYQFANLPPGTYNVIGCITMDNTRYFGLRTGITVPPSNTFAHVYMTPDTGGVCQLKPRSCGAFVSFRG
jgi:hypothetical protein